MLNPFIQEDKMNHVKKLNQYFKKLARTYNLFFKSAPLIATLVLLLVVMVQQSISYYRIQQQSFETMVERSKNARYLHYYSSLLLDRRDAKEVRLFNMFPKIIEKYMTLFEQTKRDENQIRKKQLAVSSAFVLLTVGVFGYGFYWFTNSVRTGALEVGILLMFVSVIGYISTSMARVVEDSSLLYDSLLWIEKYFNFLEYHDNFENGTDLSGGQWQKIALARDLYANGKIEFLDEPTAALDAKSEAEIYERFLRENDQKTIFFVTHRLSAVKFADKVLFLDSGKVSGFDTHANLLNKNAKYQEMYNLQKNAYI